MQIYYNADTRQLIMADNHIGISAYLQADETPATKAEAIFKAYHDNPHNVSTCQKLNPIEFGAPLPKEEGTDRLETMCEGDTQNGDDKKE